MAFHMYVKALNWPVQAVLCLTVTHSTQVNSVYESRPRTSAHIGKWMENGNLKISSAQWDVEKEKTLRWSFPTFTRTQPVAFVGTLMESLMTCTCPMALWVLTLVSPDDLPDTKSSCSDACKSTSQNCRLSTPEYTSNQYCGILT